MFIDDIGCAVVVQVNEVFGQVAGPDDVDLVDVDLAGLGLEELQVKPQTVIRHVGRVEHVDRHSRVLFHVPLSSRAGQFKLLPHCAGRDGDRRLGERG